MADFTSLKQTIQSYIKQNGNEEITGNILQDVLLAMVSTMGDSAINGLASALQDELNARQNADGILQGNITAEATVRGDADTALGGCIEELQTVINGINAKLAEGYIYAGIATSSTNPGAPSGKVFYIAVSSGTYTNFSSLTVSQGINILKYNGSSWSKDVVYAIDACPKKNSQNLVTSGGVFDNMGALDVSELNATENPHTLAQYTDLSAALAAIPTDYQKGGMSIKFVQASDNKYVQYFLTKNEWSVSGADWQKMNLEEEISQLGQSIEDAIVCLDFSNPQNGKHYVNDGTTTSDSSWACKEIDISKYKGKKAIVRLGFHIDSTFYYTNNSYIKTTNDEIVEISDCVVDNISTINDCITINLPDDSDKLLASWAIDERYAITPFAYISRMYIPTQEEIENINTQVSTLETNTEAFGFFDFANANQGKKYNSNGEIVSDHSYACKEFDASNFTGRLVVLRVGFVLSGVKYYLRDSYVKKEDDSIVAISELQYNGLPVTFDGAVIKLPDDSDKLLLSWSTDERYLVKPFCYAPFALTELVSQYENIGNTRYIAIGDSITDGTGASAELGSYATRLNAYFGFNWYLPLARGGMSVVRQDGQYSTYPILKDFIASGYLNNFKGIISLSVGTNDYGNGHSPLGTFEQIKDVAYANLRPTPSEYDATYTFAEGFRYDLETLKRKSSNATIIVLSPINRVGEETEYITGVNLQSYRDMEEKICNLLGIPFVDMRKCGIAKWNTSPVWSADNLHPNDYGYYLMTSYLIPIFDGLIKSQSYLDEKLAE